MDFIICIFILIGSFCVLPLSMIISEKFYSGPGAAIPGAIFGIICIILSWTSLIAISIYKFFIE